MPNPSEKSVKYLEALVPVMFLALEVLYAFMVLSWSDADYCNNWHIEEQCHTIFYSKP